MSDEYEIEDVDRQSIWDMQKRMIEMEACERRGHVAATGTTILSRGVIDGDEAITVDATCRWCGYEFLLWHGARDKTRYFGFASNRPPLERAIP